MQGLLDALRENDVDERIKLALTHSEGDRT
jgi:hypothetical protein